MSTAQPFKPKGDRPEWRIIYEDLLLGAESGDIITLADLSNVLGRDFRRSRSPLYRARKALGVERSRWLYPVPGKGYRVAEAREHVTLANGHKQRAKRQLGTMMTVMRATDITQLGAEDLVRFDAQFKVNALHHAILVMHEGRLNRHEAALRQAGLL